MAVKIRLAKHGAKKKPFYRIVVADSRAPRNGRIIDQVGTYDPGASTAGVKIDAEKTEKWLKQGALPTKIVEQLIRKAKSRA